MTAAQITQISDVSASRLQTLIEEHRADIIDAVHKLEGDESFTIGYAIVFDQKKDQLHNRISYGIKRKDEISGPLQNPNQPELPIGNATGEIAAYTV